MRWSGWIQTRCITIKLRGDTAPPKSKSTYLAGAYEKCCNKTMLGMHEVVSRPGEDRETTLSPGFWDVDTTYIQSYAGLVTWQFVGWRPAEFCFCGISYTVHINNWKKRGQFAAHKIEIMLCTINCGDMVITGLWLVPVDWDIKTFGDTTRTFVKVRHRSLKLVTRSRPHRDEYRPILYLQFCAPGLTESNDIGTDPWARTVNPLICK